MYATEVRSRPARSLGIAEVARVCLNSSPYPAVRRIFCECHQGILRLRGHLSSFYLKQNAQEIVARVKGVTQVVNEIEVD